MLAAGQLLQKNGADPQTQALVGKNDTQREVPPMQPPKCWCTLAAPGKLQFSSATDRLNPGRAFYQVKFPTNSLPIQLFSKVPFTTSLFSARGFQAVLFLLGASRNRNIRRSGRRRPQRSNLLPPTTWRKVLSTNSLRLC